MRLSSLIAPTEGAVFFGEDRTISGITADSRDVKQGFVFVAITGTQTDGHAFIGDAIQRGASSIVIEEGDLAPPMPDTVTLVTVPHARTALSIMVARFFPRQPQMIAAITGTSGKTSTVHFTRQLWELAGHKAASIGTLGLITPSTVKYGSLTTPDPVTLHKTIDEIAAQGITRLAMEASSHGIELHRLDHVRLNLAAFTNLSRDHLDYHQTMEKYFAAKLRLFTTLLRHDGTAFLNADIPEFETLKGVCTARGHRIMTYGQMGDTIHLLSAAPDAGGQRMSFEIEGKPYDILLPVIGSFQIENSLCALALTIGSGEAPDRMVEALTHLKGVPGRLEYIGTSPKGGEIYVDYAHKPSALENVLGALRPHVEASGAKLHVAFGCGGNRDKGKRPQMGAIAQRLADFVIITDDNPRKEDPATIREEILAGCLPGPNLREVGDRGTAIHEAIAALGPRDVLVIAGKGHEDGQIVGDTVLPFNDAKEVRKVLGLT